MFISSDDKHIYNIYANGTLTHYEDRSSKDLNFIRWMWRRSSISEIASQEWITEQKVTLLRDPKLLEAFFPSPDNLRQPQWLGSTNQNPFWQTRVSWTESDPWQILLTALAFLDSAQAQTDLWGNSRLSWLLQLASGRSLTHSGKPLIGWRSRF